MGYGEGKGDHLKDNKGIYLAQQLPRIPDQDSPEIDDRGEWEKVFFEGLVLKNSEFCGTALLLIGVAEVRLGRERVPSFTPSPF